MIAIDTNVLVRALVADDARQTAMVRRLLTRVEAEGARVRLSCVVLCETAWVLRSVYDFSRGEIARAFEELLSGDLVDAERADATERAVAAFSDGRADLADYLIREVALADGASAVATFDRIALGEDGFVEPDPASWPDGVALHERAPRYGSRQARRRVRG